METTILSRKYWYRLWAVSMLRLSNAERKIMRLYPAAVSRSDYILFRERVANLRAKQAGSTVPTITQDALEDTRVITIKKGGLSAAELRIIIAFLKSVTSKYETTLQSMG